MLMSMVLLHLGIMWTSMAHFLTKARQMSIICVVALNHVNIVAWITTGHHIGICGPCYPVGHVDVLSLCGRPTKGYAGVCGSCCGRGVC